MADLIKLYTDLTLEGVHTPKQLQSSTYVFEVLTGATVAVESQCSMPSNPLKQIDPSIADEPATKTKRVIHMPTEKYVEFLKFYMHSVKLFTMINEDEVAKDMFDQLIVYLTLKN